MVTSETGDYEDPGVPCLRGGRHAPDADIILPVVPQPRGAGERGDRGVRDPGEACVPSHRGHAPHADQHLRGDSLPSEADSGLRGYVTPTSQLKLRTYCATKLLYSQMYHYTYIL